MRALGFTLALILTAAGGASAVGQCPAGGGPAAHRFAVVSVTPLPRNSDAGYQITSDPGRLRIPGLNLRQLIMAAYGLRLDQVSGGPKWMDDTRFAVDAATSEPSDRGQEMLMLRQVLVQRFRLACHEVTRPGKLLALTLMPGPRKLKPLAADAKASPPGPNQLAFSSVSQLVAMLNQFASVGLLAHPVVDATGLSGRYAVYLHVGIDNGASGGVALGPKEAAEIPYQIEHQLGLKLVPRTEPVLHLIVDSASPLTPN